MMIHADVFDILVTSYLPLSSIDVDWRLLNRITVCFFDGHGCRGLFAQFDLGRQGVNVLSRDSGRPI